METETLEQYRQRFFEHVTRSAADWGRTEQVNQGLANLDKIEVADVAAFKAAVWAEGREQKAFFGWCSAYEAVLRDFGITALDGLPTFDGCGQVSLSVARNMQPGSILGSRTDTTWQVWRVVVGGIARLFGTDPHHRLLPDTFYQLYDAYDRDMAIQAEPMLMYLAPLGTQVSLSPGSSVWEKRTDQFWGKREGESVRADSYTPDNFGSNRWRIVSLP